MSEASYQLAVAVAESELACARARLTLCRSQRRADRVIARAKVALAEAERQTALDAATGQAIIDQLKALGDNQVGGGGLVVNLYGVDRGLVSRFGRWLRRHA